MAERDAARESADGQVDRTLERDPRGLGHIRGRERERARLARYETRRHGVQSHGEQGLAAQQARCLRN